jgi:DNA-binding MarR family transcriptional regulator
VQDMRTAVLLALEASDEGRIVGRTFLQKLVYLAGAKLGLSLPYGPDRYGPYSPDVAAEVDRLVEMGILRERVERFPAEAGVFERRRHTYSLTSDGQALAEEHLKRPGFPGSAFTEAAKRVLATRCDYRQLSLAAKVHWVLSDNAGPVTLEQARQEAKRRNWSLTPQDVLGAADLLVSLGLAQKTAD